MIELFFVERNHVCAVCVANNNCELQEQARSLGLTHFELAGLHPSIDVDATHERFVLDQNRCILCTRCVRVCDEIEGAHTWDIWGGGSTPVSSATSGRPGAALRPVRAAVSACKCAPLEHFSKRAAPCRNPRPAVLSFLTLSRKERLGHD